MYGNLVSTGEGAAEQTHQARLLREARKTIVARLPGLVRDLLAHREAKDLAPRIELPRAAISSIENAEGVAGALRSPAD